MFSLAHVPLEIIEWENLDGLASLMGSSHVIPVEVIHIVMVDIGYCGVTTNICSKTAVSLQYLMSLVCQLFLGGL